MPCYNSGVYLARAIESIAAQSFRDYEIILVNDGSTDQCTLKIIEGLEKTAHVIHQSNRGQGFARNQAIEYAQGEYLAFLDSDDLWQPFALEYFHAAITQHNSMLCFAEEKSFLTDRESELFPDLAEHLPLDCRCFGDFAGFYKASRKNVYLPGAFCVKRSILSLSNRYLEQRVNGEDLHFILQLTHVMSIAWIRQPTILAYRDHAFNSTKNHHKGVLGIQLLYRERSKGVYDKSSKRSAVVTEILSSHARGISIVMLRQRRLADALKLYLLSMNDNISLLRMRYLAGFWLEALMALFKIVR
jgi:glycosyltransferase involved in cell wall biosynthesis